MCASGRWARCRSISGLVACEDDSMDRFGLVVVDPVRAFTDPDGVIGRLHGHGQFRVIVDTVGRLALFAAGHSGPKVWVTSSYAPGQFTGGDLSHPLAQLCTSASPDDCAWDPRLTPPPDALVATKTSMDAGSCQEFVDAVDAMAGEVDAVLLTGFWLSACVAATAASCAPRLAGRVPVVLPLSLAATRLGLYDPDDVHPSEIDVTARLVEIRSDAVIVCDTPATWRSQGRDKAHVLP